MLFMGADASKEEEGTARTVNHARNLCARARVDDAKFETVEGDRGGVKRGATAGRGSGSANSASTTMIQISNGNSMAAGSDLGPAIFFYFSNFDFWCRLVTADTKNRLFFVSHNWYQLH
jgi:hypothetical protein